MKLKLSQREIVCIKNKAHPDRPCEPPFAQEKIDTPDSHRVRGKRAIVGAPRQYNRYTDTSFRIAVLCD
jgi:hypothetical protein